MMRSLLVLAFLLPALPSVAVAQAGPFTSVAGGGLHVCATDAEGDVACSVQTFAQRLLPPALPALNSVVVGDVHACGLDLSGRAICWGDNDFGQLNLPADETFSTLAAGYDHTCGITVDERIVCWGLNGNGQLDMPNDGLPYLAVDAARQTTCAVEVAGEVRCVGSIELTWTPDASEADIYDLAFTETSGGIDLCALYGDGEIACLNGDTTLDARYVDLESSLREFRVCGLREDGQLDCRFSERTCASSAGAPASCVALRGTAETFFAPFDDGVAAVNAAGGWQSITGNVTLCGIDAAGDAACPGITTPDLALPGAATPVPQAPVNLTAAVYGDTTVELLWSLARDGAFVAGSDVFRDGELIFSGNQATSYLDRTLVPGVDYRYEVRTFGRDETRSDLVATVTVNTADRAVGGPAGYTPPLRPGRPEALRLERYSDTTVELIWARSAPPVAGYEIRRDGVATDFTRGTSYLDTAADGDVSWYEVLAVDANGAILGVASVSAR